MTPPGLPDSRLRAYGQFLIAILYFFIAKALATHAARGLAGDGWIPLAEQAMLVFLLMLGYSGLGFTLNRQLHPVSAQGFPRRPGWPQEVGLGLAIGWTVALICVLALVLGGGITIALSFTPSSWAWWFVNLVWYALFCLAEEIAFRGYAFQRFVRATSPTAATFAFALLYAFLQTMTTGATRPTAAVAFMLSIVLSLAYIRTRALWVSWGINFGWRASRALVFGLAVAGDNSHSTVVQGDATGSFWLTGGGMGLESSWVAFVVLLVAFFAVYRLTRELDFRFNAPELIPGGIPVDLDAAARRQHEAAMGPTEPAPQPLIQIAPLSAPLPLPVQPGPPAPTNLEPTDPNSGNETN